MKITVGNFLKLLKVMFIVLIIGDDSDIGSTIIEERYCLLNLTGRSK